MNINTEYVTNNGSYSFNNPTHIVIHYTAGAYGVPARNNAIYYYNNGGSVECGTHYFVGDDGIFASTPEWRGAWTNGNFQANTHAINIEVACGTDEPCFTEIEIEYLHELVTDIMQRYNIQPENVIRHYDVVDTFSGQTTDPHKACPRPYIDNAKWQELKERITEMATPQEVWEYMPERWKNDFTYGQHGQGTGGSSYIPFNHLAWSWLNTCEILEKLDKMEVPKAEVDVDALAEKVADKIADKIADAVANELAKRMAE